MSDQETNGSGFREAIVEDVRPWGRFRRFPHEEAGGIKIVTVEPGGRLSLQYHESRDEFWVALDAGLEITAGDRVWTAAPNEEIFIPRRAPHRVRNVGDSPARFLEIWVGRSSESDIVRLQDDYDRT